MTDIVREFWALLAALLCGSFMASSPAVADECAEFNPKVYYEMAAKYVEQSRSISENGRFRGVYKKAEIRIYDIRHPEGSEISDGIVAVAPINVDNGTINLEIWPNCSMFVNEYRRW